MADVRNGILAQHTDRSLDITTAYFNVRSFTLLRDSLRRIRDA